MVRWIIARLLSLKLPTSSSLSLFYLSTQPDQVQCKRLLVAGAGGGREVLALYKSGYEVDGFECHPELVALANTMLT